MTLRLPRLDNLTSRLRRALLEHSLLAELRAVAQLAEGRQQPLHLVGGAVRDALLGGVDAADCDLIVPSGAIELARAVAERLGGRFVLLDGERGVGRVVLTGGRSGQLDFADYQRPGLQEDLRARDFSINALAVAVPSDLGESAPQLIDPSGGAADLCGALIRTPASSNLDDDPLRLMRAVRFAATLDFRIDRSTQEAIAPRAARLREVSAERLRDELFKIFAVDDAYPHVRTLERLGLLAVLLPELEAQRDLVQTSSYHHLDVLSHSFLALQMLEEEALPLAHSLSRSPMWLRDHLRAQLAGGRTRLALLKLGTLLHDIGKPAARAIRDDGQVSYRGHEAVGAARMRQVAERLRLARDEAELLEQLVAGHLVPLEMPPVAELAGHQKRRYFTAWPSAGVEVLVLALADQEASRGPSTSAAVRSALRERVRALLDWFASEEGQQARRPLLGGADIMATLGLEPGPPVGAWTQRLLDAQADGVVQTPEAARTWLLEQAAPEASSG